MFIISKKMGTSSQDVLWSYLGTFFSLSSGFLLLPFILKALNGTELGLWYVFLSINGLLALFDFGFAPTFARNFAYIWGGADELTSKGITSTVDNGINQRLFNLLYSACRLLYLFLSLVALILLSTGGSFYIYHITKGFSGYHFLLSWIIILISFFLNLYFDYFSSILRGIGEIKAVNVALVVSKGTQIVVSSILLFKGYRLVGAVIGFLIQGLIFRQYCRRIFLKNPKVANVLHQRESNIKLTEILSIIKIVLPNSIKDGFVSIANYASTQGSSLIISTQLSLSIVGNYSLVLQLLNAVASIAIAINNAYLPLIQIKMVKKERANLQRIIGRCQSAYMFVFFAGLIGVYFVVLPLVKFIRPGFQFSTITFLFMAVYYFLFNQQSGYATYIAAANELPYAKSFIITSIVSVISVSLVLMYSPFGLAGVVLMQVGAQAVFNNWYWPRYFFRREHLNMRETIISGFKDWKSSLKFRFREKKN